MRSPLNMDNLPVAILLCEASSVSDLMHGPSLGSDKTPVRASRGTLACAVYMESTAPFFITYFIR